MDTATLLRKFLPSLDATIKQCFPKLVTYLLVLLFLQWALINVTNAMYFLALILRECDGFLSKVWINTVQHSEELICNILRRPKYFNTEKKNVPPFASKNILLAKGGQYFCTEKICSSFCKQNVFYTKRLAMFQ